MLRLFTGERIVNPYRPAHREAAIGDRVGISGRPLLHFVVYQKRPNMQLLLGCQSAGWIPGDGVRDALALAQEDSMCFGRRTCMHKRQETSWKQQDKHAW